MSASDDETTVKDGLKAFHLDWDAIVKLPNVVRTSTTVIAIVVLIAFAACIIVSLFLLIRLGCDALTLPNTAYQDSAKNFFFAFVGVFGAPFLVWRTWVAHQQASAATKQARVALDNHITGIFSKSVELLGLVRDVKTLDEGGVAITRSVPNLESRLGALYSLERLLRESLEDQRAILETLCAYVRENSPIGAPKSEDHRKELLLGTTTLEPSRRSDVQAAITIIGRRSAQARLRAELEGWRLDFRDTNLVGYDFSGLNFDRSDFTDSFLNFAKLSRASFTNSIFINSVLKKTSVDGTCFRAAHFMRCNVKEAKLLDTNFRDAKINETDLREAYVISFDISGADLEHAFSSYLQFVVDDVKTNGVRYSSSAQEIMRTVETFRKAECDERTILPKAVEDAIDLLKGERTEEAPEINP